MKPLARCGMVAALLFLVSTCIVAQVRTKEEWEKSMKDAQASRETLNEKIRTLQSDVDRLKKEDASKAEEVKSCQQDLAAAQQQLNSLLASANREEAPSVYTVGTWAKDRDCLWNIAKKQAVYSDVWLWPKIWEDNRDQIKDPDLIYPGEKLQIPRKAPLTKKETLAEQTYYEHKHLPPQRAQAVTH